MHLGRVIQHVVQSPPSVLAVLDRCAACLVDVEVVAQLARGGVDEDGVAAPALHESRSPLVEEVTLSVGAADRTADETRVGAGARDRLGWIELEPAMDLVSGLNGHQSVGTRHHHP